MSLHFYPCQGPTRVRGQPGEGKMVFELRIGHSWDQKRSDCFFAVWCLKQCLADVSTQICVEGGREGVQGRREEGE